MNEFKVGDKVRYIGTYIKYPIDDKEVRLIKNNIYTIKSIFAYEWIDVEEVKLPETYFFTNFELINEDKDD